MGPGRLVVVALGGNALAPRGQAAEVALQFQQGQQSIGSLLRLLGEGFSLIITHGNGPQVGDALLRVELSRDRVPALPLSICVAETQGMLGYILEQALLNRLAEEGLSRPVVTLVTQVLVDREDPAFRRPTKFVGRFYTPEEARRLAHSEGWVLRKDGREGWRRVVPSPWPKKILASEVIGKLLAAGAVVICAGGGGVPVVREADGRLVGVEGVIDKDLTSAVLAADVGADQLVFLTDVKKVSLHYGTLMQQPLDHLTREEARRYLEEGHFPAGSMGPKIEAALYYLAHGGREVTIASLDEGYEAVRGETGTRIGP